MAWKRSEKAEMEDTHPPLVQLRKKRSSLLNPFRSKTPTEQHERRPTTPTDDLRPRCRPRIIAPSVPEIEEGHSLTSSSSAMFIAQMKAELFLSQFKRAQEAYLDGDLDLCFHRCAELLESPSLHLDTRIETLQLLATIAPLPVAHGHVSDALCLLNLAVQRGGSTSQMEALYGLRITTLDLLARLGTEINRFGMSSDDGGEWKGGRKNSVRSARTKKTSRYSPKVKIIYQPLVSLVSRSMPLREF